MSSIFLRIYGGLLFTLVLVAVLSGLALTIVNGMRLHDFRESVAMGTFRVMSMKLATLPEKEWPESLTRWESILGITLKTQSSTAALGRQPLQQLRKNQIHVRDDDSDNFEVFAIINDTMLLRGYIHGLNEQLATGTGTVMSQWLETTPAEDRAAVLQSKSGELFSYPTLLLDQPPTTLTSRQKSILQQGIAVAHFPSSGRELEIFSRVGNSQQILQIGPIPVLDPYPFKLLATIGLFVLASLSIAIYVLVRGLERRLNKLERAAMRLTRGDLDTRVKLHGNDSVGQLGVAFNNMASHIQRLLSIQQEMIRGISHELRTPVARIRFGLEMVQDAQSHEERDSYIEGIDGDIEELDHLIDEILTYARLEEGVPDIRFERVDIDQIASRVVAEHQRQKTAVTISYVPGRALESLRRVDVEQRYIHRAIQNLVSNACRYANSRVEVRLSLGHNNCRIDVEDDGPGIPEEQRERIFTAFARLDDSRTRSSGGYGLGLSIVRRIMHWHNGKALVNTSERLGGARFSLIWPRRQRGK